MHLNFLLTESINSIVMIWLKCFQLQCVGYMFFYKSVLYDNLKINRLSKNP